MIDGPLTEPFLDSDNLREIALVPFERLAGSLVRRSGFRANQRERPALALRDVGHVAPVGFDAPVQMAACVPAPHSTAKCRSRGQITMAARWYQRSRVRPALPV